MISTNWFRGIAEVDEIIYCTICGAQGPVISGRQSGQEEIVHFDVDDDEIDKFEKEHKDCESTYS